MSCSVYCKIFASDVLPFSSISETPDQISHINQYIKSHVYTIIIYS